ncbi:Myc-type [Macleaya cordata]|uniref:Myc-type n=1 Tax=Macleaya cordata TaxID=56857 RepID=A0A200PXJ0_MACCD|nr:Myc-type [Macleaya cordata]
MALEALVSNELMSETISATNQQYYSHEPSEQTINSFNMGNIEICNKNPHLNNLRPLMDLHQTLNTSSSSPPVVSKSCMVYKPLDGTKNSATKSRKRWRRPRVCKNKEEAETQRMTHITVERNRRRQMNEYLAVLRSLMPESYVQRGDQASIVGGAIEFVKELEQLHQSLEAQKHQLQQETIINGSTTTFFPTPFMKFFTSPQFSWCQSPADNLPGIANIEVTMIETHANIRILTQRRPRQLLKMVVGFQNLHLTILHLNLTTLDPFVLYSFSAKVEEGCHLTSVDDISAAVHHMVRVIEEEVAFG